MLFWIITIVRYLLTSFVAFLMSIVLSWISILPWAKDDSPGLGFLWIFVFILQASLLIPLSLGVTAELVERKVQVRRFKWSKALSRFLLALPMVVGPVYSVAWVHFYVESSRPTHWFWKEIFFYCLSAFFAYFALRIHRQPTQSLTNVYESLNS